MGEQFFFWLFSFLAVFTALMVVLFRNPLSSAFFLILSFINLAGIYVLLHAHFIAAAQILVYAGAIMVLFIFVIMLLNVRPEKTIFFERDWAQLPAVGVVLGTFAGLMALLSRGGEAASGEKLAADFGTLAAVARLMFTKYLVPFEVTSILLLAATVAAVLLAKRVV